MTLVQGPLLPLIALAWPLLLGMLAALPPVRARALRLLVLAPLPALALAILGDGAPTHAADLLLGVTLMAEPVGRLLFAMTACLWLAAGLYAQGAMAGTPRPAVFAGFWCLTLAGNLGVFLAGDVVTFYVAFAAVSLAAYCLVVHDRSGRALRAGRVYLVLAVIGEVCLLLGFLIGATAADGFSIAAIRAALAVAELGPLAVALLIVGFGLKAGAMPLHLWLPLAHPAAPTAASAVLSGAIVKAGLIGLMLFLPPGAVGWGSGLLTVGLAGAFGAVLLGLPQRDPKAVLAYSTVSQMGLAVALIGAALAGTGGLEPAAFYALHHGLAKGALFLAVGVAMATGRRALPWVLAGTALAALSVAGAPLTGGALVKAAAKPGLGAAAEAAFTLSAVGTALLLARFLALLPGKAADDPAARAGWTMTLPWLAATGAALVAPWLLWESWSGLPAGYPWRAATLWAAAWPVLIGLALAGLGARRMRRWPGLPPGDAVVWLERGARAALTGLHRLAALEGSVGRPAWPVGLAGRLGAVVEAAERLLLRWQIAGLALLALLLAVFAGVG